MMRGEKQKMADNKPFFCFSRKKEVFEVEGQQDTTSYSCESEESVENRKSERAR